MDAYSGFRLESDIKKGGNNGLNQADLTNTDVFYTKEEFKNFIKTSRIYGVNIVPEIDTPAHSLALTKVRPDLRHGTYGRDNDHLNLTSKYNESIGFVKDIFNEYMGNDLADPVFDKDTIVHVGADEYNANHEAYRQFADDMLEYVQDTGRQARIWGSLTISKGNTPVRSKDVQMNLWNFGYSNMDQMYEEGYDLINCNDGDYYIVPNAGYYLDYLDNKKLYNLPINSIGGVTIPAGDKQMIGGSFAVWNDMVDYLDNGVSEYDIYQRIQHAMPLFGAKLWGKGSMNLEEVLHTFDDTGSAPETNFNYEVESNGPAIANYPMDATKDISNNSYHLKDTNNASIEAIDYKNALLLNGGESYISSPLTTIGLGNDLRVKVKRTSSSKEEQILFESSYGSIKAVQKDTGCVGFSRENFNYSFNYELPINEWIELEFKNVLQKTELYVNGTLVDTLGDGEKVEGRPLLATMMIPFERVGSKTNAFIGYVDDFRLGKIDSYNSTMELDYLVWTTNKIFENKDTTQVRNLINQSKELFREFAPDATEIQTLTNQLQEIIKAEEFKKADYSRVDGYCSLIPEDLSIFTDSSVSKLNNVLNSIRRDLPISMQYIVDSYEKQLESAIHNLVMKEARNITYIDNKRLEATASSYQDASSSPSKVLDNDPNTMWHSKWTVVTMPHWIDIEIDTPEAVNALTYIPRQTGVNGTATKYEIHISDDGINYKKIKEGSLANNQEAKVIDFDPVTTKHVRLVYIQAVNNNGSASAIKLHSTNVVADVEGLKQVISKAEAIKNIGFTETSWNALQEKITESKNLANEINPDANDVEVAKRELQSQMLLLLLKEKADTSKLESLIAEVKAMDLSKYTDASVKLLTDALTEAESINMANTNQAEVDTIYDKLKNARENLVEKTHIDTSILEEIINHAKTMDFSKYTNNSVENLKKTLVEAEELLKNNPSQTDVNNMITKILDAISKLEINNPTNEVEKEKLKDLIALVEAIDKTKYTKETVQELELTLQTAKNVLDNSNDQLEINAAYEALLTAVGNLKQTPAASVTPDQRKTKQESTNTGDTTSIAIFIQLFGLSGLLLFNKKRAKREL